VEDCNVAQPGGGPETMDIEGAHRQGHKPTAVRQEFGLRWPESTSLDQDNIPGHVTRLIQMEYRDVGTGTVRPGWRLRFTVDRAEPAHNPRCEV
jgi:hypothetical protein